MHRQVLRKKRTNQRYVYPNIQKSENPHACVDKPDILPCVGCCCTVASHRCAREIDDDDQIASADEGNPHGFEQRIRAPWRGRHESREVHRTRTLFPNHRGRHVRRVARAVTRARSVKRFFFSRYFFFPEGPNRTQESVREVFWRPCNLPCHRRGLIGEPTKMYSAVFLVPIYSPQLLLSRRLVRSISYSIISLMKEAAVQIGTEGKCE